MNARANDKLIFGENRTESKLVKKILVGLFALVLLGTISFVGFNRLKEPKLKVKGYKTVTVKSGDTLWNICNDNLKVDTRRVINEVQQVNGIGSNIKAGMVIKVPIYK